MTILDFLKQLLGSEVDGEISDTSNYGDNPEEKKEPTNNENEKSEQLNSGSNLDNKETPEQKENPDNNAGSKPENKESEEQEQMVIFEDGWFNNETGALDLNKVKNAEVAEALKVVNARYVAEKQKRLLSDAIGDELKNYSLAVTEDTLRKCLDLTNVTVKDGKVIGVKDALESLKKAEPGFFKDKEKQDNPLNEGFNPVEKTNNNVISSFSQAFQMMDELG